MKRQGCCTGDARLLRPLACEEKHVQRLNLGRLPVHTEQGTVTNVRVHHQSLSVRSVQNSCIIRSSFSRETCVYFITTVCKVDYCYVNLLQ